MERAVMPSSIKILGMDADDTLWQNEEFFLLARGSLCGYANFLHTPKSVVWTSSDRWAAQPWTLWIWNKGLCIIHSWNRDQRIWGRGSSKCDPRHFENGPWDVKPSNLAFAWRRRKSAPTSWNLWANFNYQGRPFTSRTETGSIGFERFF